MTITTATRHASTDEVLVEMLTENTGVHFLDSGGAYGRAWERNQGKTLETYMAERDAWEDRYGGVTLSLFHWLRERLEYDPIMDRKLHLFNLWYGEHESWLGVMESFAGLLTGKADRFSDGYLDGTYNSYNHEDALSQTIQFTIFTDPCTLESYCLLQIHGGCDVRGGYTRPRAFKIYDDAGSLLDFDSFDVVCDTDHEHSVSHRSGEWTTYEGDFTRDPWTDAGRERKWDDPLDCPTCAGPVSVHATPF